MAESNLARFRALLSELFMFDRADLDFGIYRIMNVKRAEIARFLDNDLLPQVRATLAELKTGDRAELEAELAKAVERAKELGVDPETTQKVKDLKSRIADTADVDKLENEVFSDLYGFFRRYYSEGDFISLRRYKEGVYAIPYEGEEVKLHWANADQYYVKTSLNFRDYAWRAPSGRRVHFRVVEAEAERDNVKAAQEKDRRFILTAEKPVGEDSGELVIGFEYRADAEKRRQDALNAAAAERIMASAPRAWRDDLAASAPTEKNASRTLLEKHLGEYTARNTFDYFIHKDLGGFMRRELDFYIKSEVMHLDDVESESAPRVEQYLAKIRAIRRIAHKIIAFLAQLEDFQKRLWLKKKFVVETNYCVTLDRVPEALYPEIAKSDAQREEWVRLFAIDEITGDLHAPKYSKPLTVKFLKANSHLVCDTRFFDGEVKDRLLRAIADLHAECDGLAIGSDNFQALVLLEGAFSGDVDCIYIDPPYNTSGSEILYKNEYKHSSWLALVMNRVARARPLLSLKGIQCTTIDDAEAPYLHCVLEGVFGQKGYLATVPIRSKPQGRAVPSGFSPNHEYAIFYANSGAAEVGRLPRDEKQRQRYKENDESGIFAWSNFRATGANSWRANRPKLYYAVFVSENGEIVIPDFRWDAKAQAWKPQEIPEAYVPVYPIDDDSTERVWTLGWDRAKREAADLLRARHVSGRWQIYRKYRPHQDGALPGTWWDDPKYSASESGTKILADMMGGSDFTYPKSLFAVEDCLRACNVLSGDSVLDYFAGSGTTAHAVINLNREDGGSRKYILVEMGDYFDTVLKPRIQKVVYCKDWKDGKPVSRDTGISHMFKYIRLESYEDALNNLEVARTDAQGELLTQHPALREDYTLRYMLDVETRGSMSLLNVKRFENPFAYTLKVAAGSVGETREVNVDLVETFNWLLGLRVRHIDTIRGFRVVEGTSPAGEKVLVIWRNVQDKPNKDLDAFFLKQKYNTRDNEFDVVYVNGDNNLENLKKPDDTWKVRLIEEEFQRLMFEAEDV